MTTNWNPNDDPTDPADEYDCGWDDHYDTDPDWGETQFEEDCERAATCKCGAWCFDKKGNPIHVADCCCGAE